MDIFKLKEELIHDVERLGYELFDLEYVKESGTNILRLTIDKNDGIGIDDCVNVSNSLVDKLDELDPIDEEYNFEVSSPGAERKLRNENEIKEAITEYVYLETMEQKLSGYLESYHDGEIILKVKNKKVSIDYVDVTLIRKAIKF